MDTFEHLRMSIGTWTGTMEGDNDLIFWHVEFTLDGPDDTAERVGYIDIWAFETFDMDHIVTRLDEHSGDLVALGDRIRDLVDKGVYDAGPRMMIVDMMMLEEQYRGKGWGPELLVQALRVLHHGHAVAFGYASPPRHHDEYPDDDVWFNKIVPSGQKKLRETWARIGFKEVPEPSGRQSLIALDFHSDDWYEACDRGAGYFRRDK